MDTVISWAISALGGAVGGNLAGLIDKFKSVSPWVKTFGGAIGGLVGGQGLSALGVLKDLGNGGNAGASAAVGALVTAVMGMLRKRGA